MKTIHTLLIIILAFTMLISSCSIKMRRWKCSEVYSTKNTSKMLSENSNSTFTKCETAANKVDTCMAIVESASKKNSISVKSIQKNNSKPKVALMNLNTSPSIIKESKELSIDKKNLIDKKYATAEDEGGDSGLKIVGWILIILGLLILLFASILIGALLMLLGLVFALSGGSSKNNGTKNENTKQYVDVVYLKNGSVIKGLILEQIPNVTIKIQTKDGSVFVYKMDEIEKITKEESK